MSVTFTVETNTADISGWRLEDYDGCIGSKTYTDRVDAVTALVDLRTGANALPGCPDADDSSMMDAVHIEAVYVGGPVPELNVSNCNAMTLLDVLGLRPATVDVSAKSPTSFEELIELAAADDLYGSATAEDMLGRILVAKALVGEDAGVPSHEATARIFVGGRRAGYINDRLDQLSDLVQFATQRDRLIHWA